MPRRVAAPPRLPRFVADWRGDCCADVHAAGRRPLEFKRRSLYDAAAFASFQTPRRDLTPPLAFRCLAGFAAALRACFIAGRRAAPFEIRRATAARLHFS